MLGDLDVMRDTRRRRMATRFRVGSILAGEGEGIKIFNMMASRGMGVVDADIKRREPHQYATTCLQGQRDNITLRSGRLCMLSCHRIFATLFQSCRCILRQDSIGHESETRRLPSTSPRLALASHPVDSQNCPSC